jgi:hypothetical protein
MKYRIIVTSSIHYPYTLQRGEVYKERVWWKEKEFIRWHDISIHDNIEKAQKKMYEDIQITKAYGKELHPGTVVFEYDDGDLVVEKLKGLR